MEISLEKSLTPENDLQELWELNGRVKAVLAWMAEEDGIYIEKIVLAAMLGAPMQANASDTEPKDVFSRIGVGPKPEAEETEGESDGEN